VLERPVSARPQRVSCIKDVMRSYLDFEKPVGELEQKIEELRAMQASGDVSVGDEIARLEGKAAATLKELYENLTPWQKTQVARWPTRPHCLDYVAQLITEFTPFSGDRKFGDDEAIVGGFGRFKGESICVIGQEKGSTTESRLKHNFGMARPEGYRKAVRLMEMADRFGIPVLALVDTAGAYPGIGAEERGQAEAIATCLELMAGLRVPSISVVIGEGGSGGAVAFATADRIAMLEHSIYSVISPEGCASILWKDAEKMKEAAEALRLTAQDLLALGVIDSIVPEPTGGAQRDKRETISRVGTTIAGLLSELDGKKSAELRKARRKKFLDMGQKALVA
jgi:acetyl-CoA carboxylase carboxyl transferase subunit alpha